MKQRTVALLLYWLVAIAAILSLTIWAAGVARASIDDCLDATCRITAGDGGRGTGCVFERSEGRVFVLTCAHVVGDATSVQCEFWRDGHLSRPLPSRVTMRSGRADAAIVTLPEAAFGGFVPKPVPIAPRTCVVRPGQTLTSVGCANGSWSTGWKGHALGNRGTDLHFTPTPANGRSGSAIFDAHGRQIVGLLRARTGNDSEGIATSIQGLYAAFGNHQATSQIQNPKSKITQCPGGQCPTPQTTPQTTPWRLLPYRHGQDEQFRQIQGQQSQQQVWPTLPIASQSPPVDLGPTNQRIDGLTDKVGQLLEELRRQREAVPTMPMPPIPTPPMTPPVDDAAMKAAEEAKAEATAVKEASEKALDEVKQESGKVRELINTLIGDRETLRERIEARLAKVKEELGSDASKQEVARAYLKDLVHEKLSDGSAGMTTGKVLGGALGLSGPLAFGIGIGLFFIARRIGHKVEAGEPLLIQRLIDRLDDRFERIKDRIDARQGDKVKK